MKARFRSYARAHFNWGPSSQCIEVVSILPTITMSWDRDVEGSQDEWHFHIGFSWLVLETYIGLHKPKANRYPESTTAGRYVL